MKNFIFIFALTCSWFATQAQTTFTLKGSIQNFEKGQACKLHRLVYNDYSNRPKLLNSQDIQCDAQGNFNQVIELTEASVYYLTYGRQKTLLVAYPQDQLQVTIKPKQPIIVKGSEATNQVQRFYEKMQELDKKYIHKVRMEFMEIKMAQRKAMQQVKDQATQQAVKNKYAEPSARVMAKLTKASHHFFDAMAQYLQTQTPTLALYASFAYWKSSNVPYLKSSVEQLAKKMPNNSYTKQMQQKINRLNKLRLDKKAPEIALANADNKMLRLSEVVKKPRNKYVLVDFWATWCAPCLIENKNLKRLYDKYAKLGFEIYAVSLDRQKEVWLKYLKKQPHTWPQVFVPEGFQSQTSLNYNLKELPTNLLLDSEGKIIGKNLFGNALKEKLASLFEN